MKRKWTFLSLLAVLALTLVLLPATIYAAENGQPDAVYPVSAKSGDETCIVLKTGEVQAYVNGEIQPTKQYYYTGFATLEIDHGVFVLPLDYTAQITGFSIEYNPSNSAAKLTNPSNGEYLIIPTQNTIVSKYSADGTLLCTLEAPYTSKSFPLRFTCEAMGLNVSYQNLSDGEYIIITSSPKTNSETLAIVDDAMNCGLGLIPITTEYFDNQEFCDIISQYDTNHDQFLSHEEFDAVKTMVFDSTKLYSVPKLSFFPNLENVIFTNNSRLNDIDLSKNPKIKTIECSDNGALRNLELSKCPELTSLIFARNQCLSLNLAGNPALKSLTVIGTSSGAPLINVNSNVALESLTYINNGSQSQSSLNLNNNLALKSLELSSRYISSLDLSKNIALTSLSLTSTTELHNLDLSKNAQLKDLKLNKLTLNSFTLNNSINLESLYLNSVKGISAPDVSLFPALKTLYLESFDLPNFDLSKNTELTSLTIIRENKITALDLSKNTKLQILNLCYAYSLCNIDLSKNTALEFLEISGPNYLSSIGIDNCPALKQVSFSATPLRNLNLKNNTALTKLNCVETKLTTLDLKQNTALTSLTCPNNPFLYYIDISNNTALTYLDCSSNTSLTNIDVSKNIALTTLECVNSGLTNLNLNSNTKLTTLACWGSRISHLDLKNSIDTLSCDRQGPTTQTVKTPDGWAVNLKDLIGEENLSKIRPHPKADYQYDPGSGIATFSGEQAPVSLTYYYQGTNLSTDGMQVLLNLYSEQAVSEENCVIMKLGAEKASVNGVIKPTTQYETGYAKMENVNGTMMVPVRYLAEVTGFTVEYDESTNKTKVTNPTTGEYLIITTNSKTVSKYSSDGLILTTADAPIAFSVNNGITVGALRFTCEMLGKNVSYQELDLYGIYVVITDTALTDSEASEKAFESYKKGL